ncbi:hypothetical protein FRB90_003489 [Tulasnella sp. 427]|nr:hypothetical protein FRB90_003489 [Tulasnella sp. 427]
MSTAFGSLTVFASVAIQTSITRQPPGTSNMQEVNSASTTYPDQYPKRLIEINAFLPLELLVNIFDILYTSTRCPLPLRPSYEEAENHFRRPPLLELMLVCRKWHWLIEATPSYWTYSWIGLQQFSVRWRQQGDRREITDYEEDPICVEKRLAKSGSLPLHLVVVPTGFDMLLSVLGNHARRLESLSILGQPLPTGDISEETLVQVLQLQMPSLKRLYIEDDLIVISAVSSARLIMIDAPEMRQISAYRYLIFPQTPSNLTFLSISCLPSHGENSLINMRGLCLPQLLELHIFHSKPGLLLSILSMPTLRILIFHSQGAISRHPPDTLPSFPNLRRLEWSDTGPDDHIFNLISQRCPNLTHYCNYVVGKEMELEVDLLEEGLTILEAPGGIATIPWPRLEEVAFDWVTCAQAHALLDIVPTIKRIRTLRSPIEDGDLESESAQELLKRLKGRVDVAVGLSPWSHASMLSKYPA